MEDQDDREADVRFAVENYECPKCHGDMECEGSGHERDSSYDRTSCVKCGWCYVECETWDLD